MEVMLSTPEDEEGELGCWTPWGLFPPVSWEEWGVFIQPVMEGEQL